MMSAPHLGHGYAEALPELSLPWTAARPSAPRLLVLNEGLARELDLDADWLRSAEGVAFLTGRTLDGPLPGTTAQAYAGHQFGAYSPRLGDGRALLLGELDSPAGLVDLHLKGSGRTPFARGGDGLAAVGPMLREYVIGEAMHGLGIATTRALAVIATEDEVYREQVLPGAVLCRMAPSHLRVGTFQFAAANGGPELTRRLMEYAVARHYPDAAEAERPALALLSAVAANQARLIASWLQVGFVHGVMNTDNCSIPGVSIDFGPCAFIDRFSPGATFSSIDQQGRYAFGNQPAIGQWNLARFAEALLPLIDPDVDKAVELASEELSQYAHDYETAWRTGMATKLGVSQASPELVSDLLTLLDTQGVDWTMFFRALADGSAELLFSDPEPFRQWLARREPLVTGTPESMKAGSPIYIPRNHLVEAALQAGTAGDLAPVEELVRVLADPFTERPGLADYALPPADETPYVTYCGTCCSAGGRHAPSAH